MERMTIYYPTKSGTTAQVVRVVDTDPDSGDVKVEVIGRVDGSSRSIGSTKWMKPESLRYNYRPQEYVPADQVTGRVDLSTGIHLDDTVWYPEPSEPEQFERSATITVDAETTTTPSLFALLEEQTARINQIGTVNTDVLKELRQIRGLMAKLVTFFEQATEDEPSNGWGGDPMHDLPCDTPPPPHTTEELTSGASYLKSAAN